MKIFNVGRCFALSAFFSAQAQLSAPDNLKLRGKSQDAVLLVWKSVANADSFKVSYSTDSLTFIHHSYTIDTSYIAEGLNAETKYFFYVQAMDEVTPGNIS
ncbi:MAG: fibronectin type III domain-containing protein, partial [Bacteroidales bacterium]|nr:fibronectin type III domain-containing protein [Bacteroidales bacterium]